MRHGSLFSGIGGFDLAAEWMGWENVFHCEWNEFGQKILKHYWPNAISYGDITKTDFTIHRRRIDIITGGFPCQPYSLAGKRKGKEDERHLWPEMLRAIREIQPGWIVGENVPGIISWSGGLVFHEVQTDLEDEGYEVFPVILPACSVNAPHKRERIWFVAHSVSRKSIKTERTRETVNESVRGRQFPTIQLERLDDLSRNVTYSHNKRLQRGQEINGWEKHDIQWSGNGINIGTGSTDYDRQERSNFINFPTQPPICSGNDGISSKLSGITFPKWRNESIKGYGNAIVPQVVYQIFKAIEQVNYEYTPPKTD